MSKEAKITEFAIQNDLNLTGLLTHNQVEQLARAWLPEIRFHEQELYHPINLRDYFEIPGKIFPTLPEADQMEYMFNIPIPDDSSFKIESLSPAVLKNDGPVVPFTNSVGQVSYLRTSNVLASGDNIVEELFTDTIGTGTEISQGNGAKGSKFFFGSKQTANGQEDASEGNPFVPMHELKIIAEYKVLVDLLEYELLVDADNEYPQDKDALRNGFEISNLFFTNQQGQGNTFLLPSSVSRDLLLALISAHRTNNNTLFQNIIDTIPAGWSFNYKNWQILTQYAFMEYYFYYAYSNWSDYENDWFSNYHEGDLEGCCIVFETRQVENEFTLTTPDPLNVAPIAVISSVHEEFQNLDRYKALDPLHARADLKVWVALGSHATYLSPGNHDVGDLGVYVNTAIEESPVILLPIALVLAILAAIIEHFVDTEDKTSDHGGYTDNNEPDGSSDRHFGSVIETTPLSEQNNIYKNNDSGELAIRSYPGKYGGTSGLKNRSSNFKNKSGRYYRKLIKNVNVIVVD